MRVLIIQNTVVLAQLGVCASVTCTLQLRCTLLAFVEAICDLVNRHIVSV